MPQFAAGCASRLTAPFRRVGHRLRAATPALLGVVSALGACACVAALGALPSATGEIVQLDHIRHGAIGVIGTVVLLLLAHGWLSAAVAASEEPSEPPRAWTLSAGARRWLILWGAMLAWDGLVSYGEAQLAGWSAFDGLHYLVAFVTGVSAPAVFLAAHIVCPWTRVDVLPIAPRASADPIGRAAVPEEVGFESALVGDTPPSDASASTVFDPSGPAHVLVASGTPPCVSDPLVPLSGDPAASDEALDTTLLEAPAHRAALRTTG